MATTTHTPRHVAPALKWGGFGSARLRRLIGRQAVETAAIVAVSTVGIVVLYAAAPDSPQPWRYYIQHLFYFPIVYSGLRHGWLGGLSAALAVSVCFLGHLETALGHAPDPDSSRHWQIPIFCAAGILSGIVSQRERRQKLASDETARRLAKVYEELQENFERMKRAERLYALGQLSAGLAHEIRNPLASIAGATGILRRGRSSEQKQAECLEIINKECQRLSRLLTSFLDFARPRPPNFLHVSIESVFDSVLGLAEHAVNGVPIHFRRQHPEDLTFDCDPEQLKQVLLNLVINAVQAMPGGGEVLISARAENGKVIIEVRDQGCGVSPEEMEHLYDPFFTTKENGTGLGLPVAHQIVAHWGGVLAARNNPERGVTFSVELPLRQKALP
jgi:two-component system, NtrC family, sensor histidine kinase HydH